MSLVPLRFLVISAALAGTIAAHATTIDFEAQAASAPSSFGGVVNSPLVIGTATFTGGQLLKNEINSADLTGVYATSNFSTGPYANPIQIAFSSAVTGFSLLLTNNIADTYTVTDNLGDTVTSTLGVNATQTLSLTGSGITSVRVTEAGTSFDFAIDNVTFSPVTTATTPEPSTLTFLGTGILGLVGMARRRLAA